MPVSSVRNIISHIKQFGTLAPQARSGRPKKLSDRDVRTITTAVKKEPSLSSRAISIEFAEKVGKKITPRTVRRYLTKYNLRAFRKVKKHLLTKAMKLKRIRWAKAQKNQPIEYWDQVIFSDESCVQIFVGNSIYARRPRNSRLSPQFINQSPKFPTKLMVWGCFSSLGVGHLKIIDGTMNSDSYINVLAQKMLPSANQMFLGRNFVFQDDSAPCHRSKKTKNWLAENKVVVLDWPGNSPDLNPIENMWAILKQKVRQQMPKTKIELVAAIKNAWYKQISPELCQKLVQSMPKRIEQVIANKGGHTKY